MTIYTKTLSSPIEISSKLSKNSRMGSKLYYSNGGTPETWTEEIKRIKLNIIDSIAGRSRLLEAHISNLKNLKEPIYTSYKRIKFIEQTTGLTIFLGRVELSEPYWDNTYGQMLKVVVRDYSQELFERKVSSDYSATAHKRSELIAHLITDYTTGPLSTNIEASGSSSTIGGITNPVGQKGGNYTNCEKAIIQLIEELAQEDYWTDDTWTAGGKVYQYTGSYVDVTAEADSSAGTPFNFIANASYYFYMGQNNPFLGAEFDLAVNGSYGAQTWQYSTGHDTWETLTISQVYAFTADGTIKWNLPTDWVASEINSVTKYWIRCSVASVTTIATVNHIHCERGCGYDYYVDDTTTFQYFRRGSKPSGGASSSGLTIALQKAETTSKRSMFHDYNLTEQPKEIVTRVTCYGNASTGEKISYPAINSTLETTYGIIKEKQDFVWGSEMSEAELLTYCTNRAKALLGFQSGIVKRGTVKIKKYPYFGNSATLVRVGDMVRLTIPPKSIDEDYMVLEVKYEEPPGTTTLKVVSNIYGRGYSPFETTTVLQGLRSGSDISIQSARINDLIVNNAKIVTCSITKLTAGDLKVVGTIVSGGKFVTGPVDTTRIEISVDEIVGYNASNVKQFYLQASDGKAYAGGGAIILDSTALSIYGQLLKFYSGTTYVGVAGAYSTTAMWMGAAASGIDLSLLSGNLIYAGRSILPTSTSYDLGDATNYWDDVNYTDLIDRASAKPIFDSYSDVIKGIKTKRRKVTIKQAEAEGMGKKTIKRIKKYDGKIEEFDLDTFPEDLLDIPTQEDYDKAEQRYQQRLKEIKGEGGETLLPIIKLTPRIGKSLNDQVYVILRSQQEILDRLDKLEAK